MVPWLAGTPVVALEKHYPECSNEALLRVWVPTEHVGLVIGRSGATVNALKKKTGVNIQVVLKGTDEGTVEGGSADDVSLWTPLTCAGTPHGLQTAWRDIIGLIEEEEDVVAELKINVKKHSTLIGPKGATIRRLSASTGVRIHVPKMMSSDRVIALEGSAPQVFACMRAVLEVCRHGTDAQGVPNQLSNTSDDRLPDGSCPKTFPFAESVVSHLAAAPVPGGAPAAGRSPKNATNDAAASDAAAPQPPLPPSPPKVVEPTECRVLQVPLSKLPLLDAKSPLPGGIRGGRGRPPTTSFSQVAKVTGTKIKVKGAPPLKARTAAAAAAQTDNLPPAAPAADLSASKANASGAPAAGAAAGGGSGSDRRRRVDDSSAGAGEDGEGDGVVASVMDEIVGAVVDSDGGDEDGDDEGNNSSENENKNNDEEGNDEDDEDDDDDEDEFADATGSGDEAEAMVAGVISNDDDEEEEEEQNTTPTDNEISNPSAAPASVDDGATCEVSIEGPVSRVAAAAAALNLLLEGQPLREATTAAKNAIREANAAAGGDKKKKAPRGGKNVKKGVGKDSAAAAASDASAPPAAAKASGRRGAGRNNKPPAAE